VPSYYAASSPTAAQERVTKGADPAASLGAGARVQLQIPLAERRHAKARFLYDLGFINRLLEAEGISEVCLLKGRIDGTNDTCCRWISKILIMSITLSGRPTNLSSFSLSMRFTLQVLQPLLFSPEEFNLRVDSVATEHAEAWALQDDQVK
jgi:hypothetical protein